MQIKNPRSGRAIALRLVAAVALVACALAFLPRRSRSSSPAASDSYYMVIYSAEEGKISERAHCFATFARVTWASDAPTPRIELHHINWFSVRGHRCGWTYNLVETDGKPTRPEPGENRTTRDALELVLGHHRRVTRWGPYEIKRELYEKAMRQIDLLEGRIPGKKVLYKSLDLGYRDRPETPVLNCIHAVSDIVREPALLRTWMAYGDPAARKVVRHLRPWIKSPAIEPPGLWHAIWEEIWRGAPKRRADTIARAELDPDPGLTSNAGTLASAGASQSTGGTR